jgi:uncharacterized membrane protein YidH (DUF202 family)
VLASGRGDNQLNPYVQRGVTVFGEAPDRLSALGLGSVVVDSIRRFGFLGGGLGIASQGSQHFGRSGDMTGYSAEGGLGKITTELGVPGLAVILVLVGLGARFFKRLIHRMRRAPALSSRFVYGIVALVVANTVTYLVAAQVFGDPFVLLILGLCVGFLLAIHDRSVAAHPPVTPKSTRGAPQRRPLVLTRAPAQRT